jgi:hypothetical protein
VVARFGCSIIGCSDHATNGAYRQTAGLSIADVVQSLAPAS